MLEEQRQAACKEHTSQPSPLLPLKLRARSDMVCESALLIFSPSCLPPTRLPLQFFFSSCHASRKDGGMQDWDGVKACLSPHPTLGSDKKNTPVSGEWENAKTRVPSMGC